MQYYYLHVIKYNIIIINNNNNNYILTGLYSKK